MILFTYVTNQDNMNNISTIKQALFVIFYIFVDRARLYIGSKGNKTEQILPMLLFDLLCVPIIITNVYVLFKYSLASLNIATTTTTTKSRYYLSLQTYVTRLDVVLGSIALTFVGLEIILGLLATLSFLRHKNG